MRYSKQRNLILNIVKENRVHPTAEWVFEEARKKMPSMGIATVYRNLNALSDEGEILRIHSPNNVDRFDGYTDKHYHFQCNRCGRLIDLIPKSEKSLEELTEMINTTFDMGDTNAYVSDTILNGVCSQCLRDNKKTS